MDSENFRAPLVSFWASAAGVSRFHDGAARSFIGFSYWCRDVCRFLHLQIQIRHLWPVCVCCLPARYGARELRFRGMVAVQLTRTKVKGRLGISGGVLRWLTVKIQFCLYEFEDSK